MKEAMSISISEFQRRVKALDGERLLTHKSKTEFLLHVTSEGLIYTPESSGKPRPDSWRSIGGVIDRFAESRSLRPVDYQDITHHSSYLLAVLRHIMHSPDEPTRADSAVEQQVPGPAYFRPPRSNSTPQPGASGTSASGVATSRPHQRVGAVSNAHVGAAFEQVALEYFERQGISLTRNFAVPVGLSSKKPRNFDLGSAAEKILVECKSHRWTAGARVPSAKMTVWNEAMYYFFLAPDEYRKILFVLHDAREEQGESLLAYYKRMYAHLIPEGVEFLEWNEATGDVVRV